MANRLAMCALLFGLLIMSGCAGAKPAMHQYLMKGQILEVAGKSAYLCIGSADGAQVGQEYDVYKHVKAAREGRSAPYYKREFVGEIQIIDIVDEHYAEAKILSGDVKANYIAELKNR